MGLEWTWVLSILHVLLVPSCLTHDNSNIAQSEYYFLVFCSINWRKDIIRRLFM